MSLARASNQSEDWLGICHEHLDKARPAPIHGRAGVLACCTVHQDSTPSLHIWLDDEGWPQCKCYAGCTRIELMEDLAGRGLWPPNHPALIQLRRSRGEPAYAAGQEPTKVHPVARKPKPLSKKVPERLPLALVRGGKPHTRYPFPLKPGHKLSEHGPWIYHAADADQPALVLYRIDTEQEQPDGEIRRGKVFMQFTPRRMGDGKIQWRATSYGEEDLKEGGPLHPYGYERIGTDPRKPVFIVEGEKAADALRAIDPEVIALSLLASGVNPEQGTTIHTLDALAGENRRIIVWPDADEPGKAKSERMVRLLEQLNRVWIACLNPADLGLDGKEDAYEWANKGDRKTLADLMAIAEGLTYRYAATWRDVGIVIDRAQHK